MGTNCSTRGGHFQYRLKTKSIWVQKDCRVEVVVNFIYLCDFSKSTELFTYRYFSKVPTPPALTHSKCLPKTIDKTANPGSWYQL